MAGPVHSGTNELLRRLAMASISRGKPGPVSPFRYRNMFSMGIGVVSGKAIFGPPLDEYWKKKQQEEAVAKETDASSK
ncbi:hypothetical protein M0R45_001501 [Rubus argutus]|uniref:Uncharacterized protein n=1 Tax=Rubus argutus TaxID=59490 RepID=A0AAW1VJU9_RUBAR